MLSTILLGPLLPLLDDLFLLRLDFLFIEITVLLNILQLLLDLLRHVVTTELLEGDVLISDIVLRGVKDEVFIQAFGGNASVRHPHTLLDIAGFSRTMLSTILLGPLLPLLDDLFLLRLDFLLIEITVLPNTLQLLLDLLRHVVTTNLLEGDVLIGDIILKVGDKSGATEVGL